MRLGNQMWYDRDLFICNAPQAPVTCEASHENLEFERSESWLLFDQN